MIKFKTVSAVTAVVAIALCGFLMFSPHLIFMLFDIDENDSAFFIGRRAAMLFLGISVLSWLGRNADHSESRQAVCLGLSVAMFALALLGIYEYLRGFAGTGILFAVIPEIIIGLMYFKIWLSYKGD